MAVQDIIDTYSEKTGWDMYSAYDLLCEYIENQQDNDCFEDFLRTRAESELALSGDNLDTHPLNPKRQEDKLLVFSASWCSPCKVMKPIVKQLCEESEFHVETIDVDGPPDQYGVMGYGVLSIPTFIALRGGKEIGRITGATTKAQILSLFKCEQP